MAVDPDQLGRDYEDSLSPARRRATGAHFTPPVLADELVALAFDDGRRQRGSGQSEAAPLVCDPACGGGALSLP